MKIQIDRRSLLAVSRFASKQDVRFYLVGVNVEATATATTLVATDGARLAAIQREAANEGIEGQGEIVTCIIPAEVVRKYKRITKRITKRNVDKPLVLERLSDRLWQIDDTAEADRRHFAPVDGRFPDWRRVVPRSVSGERARYNPLLAADYGRAAEDLGDVPDAVDIAPNGQGAALVSIIGREDFVGALMPLRDGAPTAKAPAWV